LIELSVIIPTYQSEHHLASCLRSLVRHLEGIDYEVCVVDNASTDGTVAIAAAAGERVCAIRNSGNMGFSAAINAGLRNTTGRIVMWLNPDTEVLGGNVRALLQHFDEEPSVGIIGPKVLNPDGTIQYSCRSFPSYETALFNRYSLLTKLFPKNRFSSRYLFSEWDHETIRDVDWVSGACLLHRRALIDAIGELDARFFMYIEDIDFCVRAYRNGWRVRYDPALRLMHHIAGSSRHVPFRMVVALHRSIWLYYTKHFRRNLLKDAAAAVIIWGRCAGMLVRAALRKVAVGS
jgi:GT2 family glycosyltransferase